jgi:hypothetical protein
VDTKVDEISRYKAGRDVLKAFADNAVVQVVGRDGDRQVDLLPASQFIGRISTSRILLKVVPVSYKLNSNKEITKLVVREYYKK